MTGDCWVDGCGVLLLWCDRCHQHKCSRHFCEHIQQQPKVRETWLRACGCVMQWCQPCTEHHLAHRCPQHSKPEDTQRSIFATWKVQVGQ